MHPLSWEEKMASYAILNMIMKADGIILQPELDYLNSIFDSLGMTIDDIDRLESFDYDNCRSILSSMNEEGKKSLTKIFYDMAMADGVLDPREEELIDSIFF